MWSIIKKIIKCIYILSLIASFIFISFIIFKVLSFRHIDPREILILLYANTILIVQLFLFIPQKWLSKIQNKIENYLQKRKTKQYKNKETASLAKEKAEGIRWYWMDVMRESTHRGSVR